MKVLVAGVGNVFLGDDGFGVEVVRRMAPGSLPPGVTVADYGIRGVHLAYELLDGDYDALVLIDAVPLAGEPPGTLAILEPTVEPERTTLDAHGMDPATVLHLLHGLGGEIGTVYVVGCQPAFVGERMELSPVVTSAIDSAVELTLDLTMSLMRRQRCPTASTRCTSSGSRRE